MSKKILPRDYSCCKRDHSCRAVSICPSVRLSVCHVRVLCRNE